MKRFLIQLSVIFLFLAPITLAHAHGMKWMGSGGWGMGSNYSRMYDPKTVTTVSGEVASIEYFTPGKGMHHGVHINLKTGEETVSVHLGPSWFVENQDLKIMEKDKIEVKGSKITFDGKPAIIASSVKKGDETLTLRNENGIPVWAGVRR